MISAAQISFAEALEIANTSAVALGDTCVCSGAKSSHEYHANEVHISGSPKEAPRHCIASVAFAIRDTARLTAWIVKDPWYSHLKPTIAGLARLRQGHQTS